LTHGFPVRFFLDKGRGLDSIRFWPSVDVPKQETRINALRHENSVIDSVLKHVPSHAFGRLIETHQEDAPRVYGASFFDRSPT